MTLTLTKDWILSAMNDHLSLLEIASSHIDRIDRLSLKSESSLRSQTELKFVTLEQKPWDSFC